MNITDPPIIVEETFDMDKDHLWKVITEVNQMRLWFFEEIPAFNPEVGFETSFMINSPDREFLHVWKIIEVDPGQKIVYDWRYTGYDGAGTVSFELVDVGNKTKLVLTNITTENWQEDISEFSRESAEGGWDYFIKKSLKKYVETL